MLEMSMTLTVLRHRLDSHWNSFTSGKVSRVYRHSTVIDSKK